MIPYTTWEVEVFPTKLKFRNLSNGKIEERDVPVQGAVKNFTILLDLEKGKLEVFGTGKEGYFRYTIDEEKFPFLLRQKQPVCKKRLSLGNHKKQDWELIQKRCDLAEIFPFWLRLAALIPEVPLPKKGVGTTVLLEEGKLMETFQAAFQGILSPRLEDENHLGLIPEETIPASFSPIGIIHEGARQIQNLFFVEEKNKWHFLPSLPKELHAGRFIFVETVDGDVIHLEWSKKELKGVIIDPAKTRSIDLVLQSSLKSFRIRKSLRQRGVKANRNQPLELVEKQRLYLDQFMH